MPGRLLTTTRIFHMLSKTQSHKSHLDFIRDVRQRAQDLFSKPDSETDPLVALLLSRLHAPV